MLHLSLVLAMTAATTASITLAGTAAAWAGPMPPVMQVPAMQGSAMQGAACRTGVQHVSLLAALELCPRPLATTVIARPRHVVLHT